MGKVQKMRWKRRKAVPRESETMGESCAGVEVILGAITGGLWAHRSHAGISRYLNSGSCSPGCLDFFRFPWH